MSIHGGCDSMYFLTEGKLYSCGEGQNYALGQPGDNKNFDTPVEMKIPGNPRIIRFKQGVLSRAAIVLTSKGLYACGRLADKSARSSGLQKVAFFDSMTVVDYFPEGYETLWVVVKNNVVYRVGYNADCTLGEKTEIEYIRTFSKLDTSFLQHGELLVDIKLWYHSLLLSSWGRVYVCGEGNYGKLGMGDELNHDVFTLHPFFDEKKIRVSKIAAGWGHSFFIPEDGFSVYSCGNGENGQLGHNDTKHRYYPTKIEALRTRKIDMACAGCDHSMILTSDKKLFTFGRNNKYQTGHQTNNKVVVPTILFKSLEIVCITSLSRSSAFLESSGNVWTCGENYHGHCGLGVSGKGHSPIVSFTKLDFMLKVIQKTTLYQTIPQKLFDLIVTT